MAVEISGQLTIGADSLLGFGTDGQRSTFLPMVCEGTLIAFALTEVETGVNAKKIQAYVARIDREGTELGLFITKLPDADVISGDGQWEFDSSPRASTPLPQTTIPAYTASDASPRAATTARANVQRAASFWSAGGRPARNAAIVASSMPACRDRNVCPIVQ